MKLVQNLFEVLLWNSRLVVLIPVVFSLVLSFGMFIQTTTDVFIVGGKIIGYLNPALETAARAKLQLETISSIVAIIDGYLLASIMFIFALGMYELFVSKISAAENSEFAKRLLLIQSLDDLKDRLANVILLILIVKFFQQALKATYANTSDLLILSIGVVLVAMALYLSGRARPQWKYDGKADKEEGAAVKAQE
jgi:uncharacterized membrane protein YqhA